MFEPFTSPLYMNMMMRLNSQVAVIIILKDSGPGLGR